MSAPAAPISDYVAVAEHVAKAGLIVWWRLSGATPIDRLTQVFAAHGLSEDLLPSLAQPTTALVRALQEHSSKHVLVRPIPGGRALVGESASRDDLTYEVELKARLNDHGVLTIIPEDHYLVDAIKASYETQLSLVNADDAGGWLVKLIGRFDGIRLRDTGGVYFVPEARVEEWTKIVNALHEATDHRVNQIPALRADDAVASILDALQAEAERAAAEMERELAEGITARMAKHRDRRAEAVELKVARYEEALGTHVVGLRERLEQLRAGLAAASLMVAEDL